MLYLKKKFLFNNSILDSLSNINNDICIFIQGVLHKQSKKIKQLKYKPIFLIKKFLKKVIKREKLKKPVIRSKDIELYNKKIKLNDIYNYLEKKKPVHRRFSRNYFLKKLPEFKTFNSNDITKNCFYILSKSKNNCKNVQNLYKILYYNINFKSSTDFFLFLAFSDESDVTKVFIKNFLKEKKDKYKFSEKVIRKSFKSYSENKISPEILKKVVFILYSRTRNNNIFKKIENPEISNSFVIKFTNKYNYNFLASYLLKKEDYKYKTQNLKFILEFVLRKKLYLDVNVEKKIKDFFKKTGITSNNFDYFFILQGNISELKKCQYISIKIMIQSLRSVLYMNIPEKDKLFVKDKINKIFLFLVSNEKKDKKLLLELLKIADQFLLKEEKEIFLNRPIFWENILKNDKISFEDKKIIYYIPKKILMRDKNNFHKFYFLTKFKKKINFEFFFHKTFSPYVLKSFHKNLRLKLIKKDQYTKFIYKLTPLLLNFPYKELENSNFGDVIEYFPKIFYFLLKNSYLNQNEYLNIFEHFLKILTVVRSKNKTIRCLVIISNKINPQIIYNFLIIKITKERRGNLFIKLLSEIIYKNYKILTILIIVDFNFEKDIKILILKALRIIFLKKLKSRKDCKNSLKKNKMRFISKRVKNVIKFSLLCEDKDVKKLGIILSSYLIEYLPNKEAKILFELFLTNFKEKDYAENFKVLLKNTNSKLIKSKNLEQFFGGIGSYHRKTSIRFIELYYYYRRAYNKMQF